MLDNLEGNRLHIVINIVLSAFVSQGEVKRSLPDLKYYSPQNVKDDCSYIVSNMNGS
jgi:hypothetical protein